MNLEKISIMDVAKKLDLYLKVVTSVKSYDNYNSYYNIYSESEEYCRRIVVLTKYEELEEVYDENPNEKINNIIIKDGNAWIKDFPLIMNPKNIDFDNIFITNNEFILIERELLKD